MILMSRPQVFVPLLRWRYLLLVAKPVGELYPEHVGDGRLGGEQVHLLQAQPELGGVVWGEVAEAVLVLGPVLVEVEAAITSLKRS